MAELITAFAGGFVTVPFEIAGEIEIEWCPEVMQQDCSHEGIGRAKGGGIAQGFIKKSRDFFAGGWFRPIGASGPGEEVDDVSPFDASDRFSAALRGEMAGADVTGSEETVGDVLWVGMIETQGLIGFEGTGQVAGMVIRRIESIRVGGECGCRTGDQQETHDGNANGVHTIRLCIVRGEGMGRDYIKGVLWGSPGRSMTYCGTA